MSAAAGAQLWRCAVHSVLVSVLWRSGGRSMHTIEWSSACAPRPAGHWTTRVATDQHRRALQSGLEGPPAEPQPHGGRPCSPEGAPQLGDMPVSSQWLPHRGGESPERPHSAHANSSDAASHAALPVSTNFSAAALYQDTAFAAADAPADPAYGMPDALPPAPYGRPAPIQAGRPSGALAFTRTVSADAAQLPDDPYGLNRSQAPQYQPMLPVSGTHRRPPYKTPSHVRNCLCCVV